MNPGQLKHSLIVQQRITGQDEALQPLTNWVNVGTVYCKPLPKTGREFYKYHAQNNEITEVFTIRYMNIDTRFRLKYKCKFFEILSIINVNEENQWLDLTCKAVV